MSYNSSMPSWYLFSIAALLLMGTQRFLYKVAAERDCSTPLTSAVFMGTVTLLSGAAFLISGEPVGDLPSLLGLSLANSLCFTLTTVAHIEALRRLPAAVTFPLTRLSLVVVIVFSILYFHERPAPLQWLGMLLGLAVIVVLSGEARSGSRPGRSAAIGFLAITLCVVGGAGAAISSKFAALVTSKAAFMALSYLLATFFSLLIAHLRGGVERRGLSSAALRIGLLMGLFNFFGFYAFLVALESGPLSLIVLISGMHFVIAITLSALFYGERLTPRRILGLLLTLAAVALLQIG